MKRLNPISHAAIVSTILSASILLASTLKGETHMKYFRTITVQPAVSAPEDIDDFPLLLELTDQSLMPESRGGNVASDDGTDIFCTSADGETILPFTILDYSPKLGRLTAWVRLPRLNAKSKNSFRLCYGTVPAPESKPAWDHPALTVTPKPGSESVLPHQDLPEISNAMTLHAVIRNDNARTEALQVIAGVWSPSDKFGKFDACDAGKTDGLDSTGFLGAVFDGRYVYFSPQHDTKQRSGTALRYDTHSGFSDASSWQAYDASKTDGLNTRGYYGAVYDGQYVYYIPRHDGTNFHSRVLRYDTSKEFKSSASWQAYDAGLDISYQSAAFDGRYIYFAPGSATVDGKHQHSGVVLRYDTQGSFKDKASWRTFDAGNTDGLKTIDFDGAVFDGRYVYFSPLSHNTPLRYDTTKPFNEASSWSAFDAGPLGMKRCVGAVFDGTYIYYVAYANSVNVRFDTRKDFRNPEAWGRFDVTGIKGLSIYGYDGGFFDGRFVYFVPFLKQSNGQGMHAELVRYDATAPFDQASSWKVVDVGNTSGLLTLGYNAGAYDGRFFYFAPWHDGKAYLKERRIVAHGRVLRYDSIGENGSFILKYCDFGHNGGLNGAIPGTTFTINTPEHAFTASAGSLPAPGIHCITGVYDGKQVSLFIDGELKARTPASGEIQKNGLDLVVGRIRNGLGKFNGSVSRLVLCGEPCKDNTVKAMSGNLKAPMMSVSMGKERKP